MSKPIDYNSLNDFFDQTRDGVDEIAMFLHQKEELDAAVDDETREQIKASMLAKKDKITKLVTSLEPKLEQVKPLARVDGGTINSITEKVREASEVIRDLAA